MDRYASAAQIRRDVAELIRPPRRVRPTKAAAEAMKVVSGDGTVVDWDPQLTPYMIEPLDCMGSRLYDAVVFAGPSRGGKSQALVLGYIAYKLDCDPGDGLVIHITETKSAQWSKTDLERTLEKSPRLRARLSPRPHDNNVHDRIFRAGNYLGIKHPSKNVVASADYQFVLLTDLDRTPEDIGREGDLFTLATVRTRTFGSTGMTMAESSPGRTVLKLDWERPEDEPHAAPPCTGIMSLYNQGDRRRLYWQCPQSECREWFQPVKENFNLQARRVFCPHCGTEVDPKAKRALNIASRWIPEGCRLTPDGEMLGTPRGGRIASFWMEGPAAAYQTWHALADRLERAEQEFATLGTQKTLQGVINTDWGRPYFPRIGKKKRSSIALMDRAEDFARRVVPLGVRFLIVTIDVQGGQNRRFVVQVHGVGVGREMWLVDRFNISEDRGRQVSPATHPEDWDLLTRDVLGRSYRLDDGSGRRMQIHAVGVDTGGESGRKARGKNEEIIVDDDDSVTSQAYDWYRRLQHDGLAERVYLLKGGSATTQSRVRKSYPDNTGRKNRTNKARGDVPVWILGTNLLKDTVDAMLKRDEPGPTFLHIPSWLGRWWYEELTYELRDPVTGEWKKPGKKPNEAFDLLAYAIAVYIACKAENIRWDKPPRWAAPWDQNTLVVDKDGNATSAKAKPTKRRRSAVGSSDWSGRL